MHLALKKYWNSTHLVKYNNLTINMIGLDTNIFLCSWFDTNGNTVLTPCSIICLLVKQTKKSSRTNQFRSITLLFRLRTMRNSSCDGLMKKDRYAKIFVPWTVKMKSLPYRALVVWQEIWLSYWFHSLDEFAVYCFPFASIELKGRFKYNHKQGKTLNRWTNINGKEMSTV